MSLSNNGYSYKITITGEEFANPKQYAGRISPSNQMVNPPILPPSGAPSSFIKNTISDIAEFSFKKIVEPRYGDVAKVIGVPDNFPEKISEHHFISIMRATERLLSPSYEAIIKAGTTTTGAK
jgi:hypothetical protein